MGCVAHRFRGVVGKIYGQIHANICKKKGTMMLDHFSVHQLASQEFLVILKNSTYKR